MEKNLNILLIGANGISGKYILKHLAPKFHVTALIRSPPQFQQKAFQKLKVVQGNVHDQDTLDKVTEGIDIIVSSFASSKDSKTQMCELTKKLIHSMQKNKINRLIQVIGIGILKYKDGKMMQDNPNFPQRYRTIGEDNLNGYAELLKTDISFTYICGPLFKEEENDNQYQIFQEPIPESAKQDVKTGHIADFIVKQIQNHQYSRQFVGITSK